MLQLTPDQLRSFALGIDELEACNGFLRVHRMAPPLRTVYGNTETRQVRMACPAGARFRFRSDTASFRVALRFGRWARKHFRGTLVLDGQTHLPLGPDAETERWEGSVRLPGGAVTRVLDLWLPHTAECHIESVAVDDGAAVEPAPPPKLRWLAYGDSITQGMEATLPTCTWVGRCALALGAQVMNLGVGGAVLEPALAQADPHFAAGLVTVALGTNDFHLNVPPADFAGHARSLLAAVRSWLPGAALVLISPPPWVDVARNTSGHSLDDFRAAVQSLADPAHRIHAVNGGALLPCETRFLPDAVHPNDEGFAIFAQRLLPQLQAALQS